MRPRLNITFVTAEVCTTASLGAAAVAAAGIGEVDLIKAAGELVVPGSSIMRLKNALN